MKSTKTSEKIDLIKQFCKRDLWQGAVLFLLCVACYGNSFGNGFILDDCGLMLLKIHSLAWGSLFMHDTGGFYRPMAVCFIKAINTLFGFNSVPYHFVNFSLYFLMCILFLLISRLLCAGCLINLNESDYEAKVKWIPFVSALLYCVHPINDAVVNYKITSMLAVAAICMQLSFAAFLIFLYYRSSFFYKISIFFFFCSLLSHEVAFAVLICLFFVAIFLKRIRYKEAFRMLWPYIAISFFYILIWFHISKKQGLLSKLFLIHLSDYLSSISSLLQWYLQKLFFPHNLLFLWDVPIANSHVNIQMLILILMIGFVCGAYSILFKFGRKLEICALTIFVIGFLPLCVAPFVYTPLTHTAFIEPHWFYFSSMGFFLLMACLFDFLSCNWNSLSKLIALGGLILCLVIINWKSNWVWKDNETYCSYWRKVDPLNATPFAPLLIDQLEDSYNNEGLHLTKERNFNQAIIFFNRAIELDAIYEKTYINRADSYAHLGKYKQALLDYNTAIALNPKKPEYYYDRAVIYFLENNYDKAWVDIRKDRSLGFAVDPNFLIELRKSSGKDD